MKNTIISLSFFILSIVVNIVHAQLPVEPLAPQSELLKSDNPKYAANKKLVYDMWREFLEAGQMESAEKYFAEDYMQHNPNAATGRKALVEFFSKWAKPQAVADSIKRDVVAIVAEGDLVVISFVSKRTDPANSDEKYTTTWFDMFRIKNGKIAEHWDSAEKMVVN